MVTVLGAITYPLYLLHAHIGFIIFERVGPHTNAVLLVVATILLMVVAAFGLHRFVEKPLAPKLKRLLETSGRKSLTRTT